MNGWECVLPYFSVLVTCVYFFPIDIKGDGYTIIFRAILVVVELIVRIGIVLVHSRRYLEW